MKKNFLSIKIVLIFIIMIFAMKFERTAGPRLYYFIILSCIYGVIGFLRNRLERKGLIQLLLFAVDIAIIYIMESLSRYVMNYPLHIFYIIVMVESSIYLGKRNSLIIGMLAAIVSFVKYANLLILSPSYVNIGEAVFFTLFTIFILTTIYLMKSIGEEKESKDLIYMELVEAHEKLMGKLNDSEYERVSDSRIENLTERELEICALISEGKNNKEIAAKIFISEGTVKNHLTSILKKLELRDRTQLAVFSLKNRI
jgi:DNA-binding CsgD family transcriptional regulator